MGEEDKGTIDAAGPIGWKINELVVSEPDFILRRSFFVPLGVRDHVKEDGEEEGSDNQYETMRRGRDLWEDVEEEEEEAFWGSASDLKEREEQRK